MTRRVTVTRAQREAAKLLYDRAHDLGETPDPALRAIANAELRRAEMEVWPFCCDTLRGATRTGTVTNGFRDGLEWGIPVGDATVLEIQHCPWCGHHLAHLSPPAGVRKAPAYGPVIDGPWTYGKQ